MDYGKMAYLKAEELEAKLAPQSTDGNKTIRKSIAVNTFLSANESLVLFSVLGSDGAGMIINLKLSGGTDGRVTLYLNGKKAQSQNFAENLTFMTSCQSGKTEVIIASSTALNVERADIMLFGGLDFEEVFNNIKVDVIGGSLGAAAVRDGEVRLYISDDYKNPDLSLYTVLGFGTMADIAGIKYGGANCFAVCYKDLEENVFLAIAAKEGGAYKLIEITHLLNKIDNFSISRIGEEGDSLAIAFVKDGAGYGGALKYLGARQDGVKIDDARRAELIKNADPPVVVLDCVSKNIIKVSLKELSCSDIIKLRPLSVI